MLKRARWTGAGMVLGAAATVWVQRRIRLVAQRYHPVALADTAIDRARGVPETLRQALLEGKLAMQQREAELRSVQARPSAARSGGGAGRGIGSRPDN